MKHFTKNLRWLLMSLLMFVGAGAWADTAPYYSLDTTTDAAKTTSNAYAGTGTVTLGGIEWAVNGNGQQYPWRIGGKSLTGVDRLVYTKTAMDAAIGKVDLKVGTATSITVNSLKLTVASNADFTSVIDEVTATFKASSTISFEPSEGKTWNSGAFYKFTFNVSVSGTSNRYVQFSGVDFYEASNSSDNRTATTLTFNSEGYEVLIGGASQNMVPVLKAGDTVLTGKTITFESDNTDVASVNANTGAVTLGNVAGTAHITASFAGDDTYKPSYGSYTITLTAPAQTYTSIQQLQENVTETSADISFQMTDIYVTAVRNQNAWISDGTYGALIYTTNHGLTAGQKLNGTLSNAKLVLYRGQTEITNFSSTGLTITEDALAPQVKTIDQITAANQSLLVTLENVTYDGTVLTDGTNSITPYTTFMSNLGLESGKTYNITGIVILYNTTLEIAPRTADDIVEVGATVDDREETYIRFTQGDDETHYPSGSSFTITVGDDFISPEAWVTFSSGVYLSKSAAAPYLSYSGDNEAVATVNSSTGELTFVEGATGTINVTATFVGNDSYKPSEGYYTLKVKPAEVTPTGIGDEITYDFIGVTGTTYSSWSDKEGTSGAVYAGKTAGGNTAVQMRSNGSDCGIVTTTSAGKVTMVTVDWNFNTSSSRTLDIYGSNDPYTSAADLYNSETQGTKLGSICIDDATQLVITGDYAYIGIRSSNAALYCDKITIYWDVEAPTSVATTTTIDASGLTNTDLNNGTAAGSLAATVAVASDGSPISGADVTWESSNTAVATIDAETGVVTLVSVGSTTITAMYAGVSGQYNSSSDTYQLTVTNSGSTPSGDEIFNETFAGFDGTGGHDDVYTGSVGAGSTATGTDEDDWTFEKCGAASSCLKFGTGSADGSFTTRSITLSGAGTLTFSAAGWGTGTNSLNVTATGATLSGDTQVTLDNGVWNDYTVNITDATGEITITFTGRRGFIDDIKVVEATPDTRTATIITLDPATESYNVTLGDDFTAPSAALTPADAGILTYELTYESSEETVATVDASGAVTILAAGTTTITVKYAGNDEYKPSQASYTIVVTAPAAVYTTIQELQENATSTATEFTMQMTDIYVTAIRDNQAWISDGTYGALIYTSGHGLTAGEKLNGTITGKLVLWNGATEITNFDGSALTKTSETLDPVDDMSISAVSIINQSMPIYLTDLTYNATDGTFVDDENEAIAFYDQFHTGVTLVDGHIYDVTGLIVYYNKLQLAPLTAESVVDQNPVAVEAPVFDPAGGTYDADQTVTITCATAGATIYYTLDGTDPTTASEEYTTPIAITATTTLKAIASDGTNTSTITEATYTINKADVPYAKNIGSNYFVMARSLDDLETGDKVLIASNVAHKAVYKQNNNNRSAYDFPYTPYQYGNFARLSDDDLNYLEQFIVVREGNYFYFYATSEAYKGYIYAASSNSNQLKTKDTRDDNAKAAITIDDVTGDATIKFQGTNSRNTLRYNPNGNNPIFSCYAETSTTGSLPQIYVEVEDQTIEGTPEMVSMVVDAPDGSSWMTWVAPYDMALPMTDDSGLEAYIVTLNAAQNDATFVRVYNVPANTPIILHAPTEGDYVLDLAPTGTEMEDVSANVLQISDGYNAVGDFDEDAKTATVYVLWFLDTDGDDTTDDELGFYPLENGLALEAGKAFIKLDGSSPAKFFGVNFGDATGINAINADGPALNGAIYNMAGQRVTNPTRGIYIVNGKKVLIK